MSSRRHSLLVGPLLALAACASVPSDPVTSDTFDAARAGLAIRVPSGFRESIRDKARVYAGRLRVPSIVLFTPSQPSAEEAVAGLAHELREPLGEVRITRPAEETTFAGYRAWVVEGTGEAEGHAMRWRATVVDGEEVAVMLALTPSFLWPFNQGAIRSFEESVTRAEAPR